MRARMLGIALLALALAPASLAQDAAQIDRVRADVRRQPTTEANAAERSRVLLGWARRLLAEGVPVDRVLPREQAVQIGRLVDARRLAEACPLIDRAFADLEALVAASGPPRFVEVPLANPATGASLWAGVWRPAGPPEARYPALVLIPGGLGFGSSLVGDLAPALAQNGLAVAVFDPDGRGRSAGAEDWNGALHQAGLHAFLLAIRDLPFVDPENVGILSMSYGLALAAGCLGRWPDDPPVRYFIDWEGPCDRFYCTVHDTPRFLAVFAGHTTADEAWWAEREAVRSAPLFRCRYLRIQAEQDHVQGADHGHALRMIEAATGHAPWTRINGPENEANRVYTEADPPRLLPGATRPDANAFFGYVRELAGIGIRRVRLPTAAAEVRVLAALPAGETGRAIGAAPSFAERVVRVADGVVEIEVGADPIYVVEGDLPATPRPAAEQPFGFHPASVADRDYGPAREIGVAWDRGGLYAMWVLAQPDPAAPSYAWEMYDAYFRALPPGMEPLKNITPAMSSMISGRARPGGARPPVDVSRHVLPGSYVPRDPAAYASWVRALVERYDGDGVDDMPGLATPCRTWQIGNEPPAGVTGFAEMCRATYRAIKEADPGAQVLIGGLAGFPNTPGGRAAYERDYLPILRDLAGEGFDILDVHWFGQAGEWSGCPETLAALRADLTSSGFPDVPIWMCEMGTYSGAPTRRALPAQSERVQAAEMVRRHVVAFGEGVERIFWAWGMTEGFMDPRDNDFFDGTGFIYDGIGPGDLGAGTRKVVYWTYGRMTTVLGRCDTRGTTRLAVDDDRVAAYRAPFAGDPSRGVVVLWADE